MTTSLDLAWLWSDASNWQPEAGRRISFDADGVGALEIGAADAICGLAGLPPPVNGHDHGRAFKTVDFGAKDGPLETWIPALGLAPQADPYLVAAAAFGRLARSGIAATVHCHTPQGGDPIAEASAVASAARDVGIHVAYVVPIIDANTIVYGDASPLCGRHRPADLVVIKNLTGEPAPASEQVALVEEIAHQCESNSFHVQFGPAGPQWCSPAALQLVAERSATTGRRVHMHLLETKVQREWADAAYPSGIIAALDAIGLWSARVAVAHGVWLTTAECRTLAERGATVVVNTSSNFRLRSGIAPLRKFTNAGLRFAIGLDGMAFDDDDDMLRELRLVHALHAPWGFESEGISQAEILQAATVTGWEVISGRSPQQLLKPGAAANLLVLDWEKLARCAPPALADAAGTLWARASTGCVRDLYVDGRRIVADGVLTGIDLPAIEAELLAAIRSQSQALSAQRPSVLAHQQLLTEYYRSAQHRTMNPRKPS